MIHLVPIYQVDRVFKIMHKHIHRAINHAGAGSWDLASLHAACSNRSVLMFVDDLKTPTNVLLGTSVIWSGTRVFFIIALAGEGKMDWDKAIKELKEFATGTLGATRMAASCREGIKRRLKTKTKTLAYLLEFEV